MRLVTIVLGLLLLVLPATMGHTTGNSGRIVISCSAPVAEVAPIVQDSDLMPGLILF